MDAKDDALAIETSIIENVARLAPTEMEQYEAFKVLADKGQSVDDIAAVFGITPNSVKRRLALGRLFPMCERLTPISRLTRPLFAF